LSIITGFPSYAVAVNTNTNEVFAADENTNTLVAINETSGRIVGNVSVGRLPYWIAVNQVTNMVYVTSIYTDSLAVVNAVNFEVVANIPFASLTREVAVDPTTNKIFVSSLGDGTVSAIDGATNSVVAKVSVGNSSDPIAVNQATHLVYIGSCGNATTGDYVSVMSGLNYSIVDTIKIGGCPEGIVANPLTNKVYVSAPPALLVIDGANNRIISSIKGAGGSSLSVNPTTDYIYAADGYSGSVVVVDAARGRVVATIPMGAPIFSVAVNQATNLVYAANFNFYAIQIIDGRSNTLIGEPVVGILKACVSATSGCDANSAFAVTLINNGTVAIEPTAVTITVSENRGGTAVYATFNINTSFTLVQTGPAQEVVLASWSYVANRTSTFFPGDFVGVQVCLPIGPCVMTNETVIA
jgi:YVTN family beta-propeller protein